MLWAGPGLVVIGLACAVTAALESAPGLASVWFAGRSAVGRAGLVGGSDLVVAGLGLFGAVWAVLDCAGLDCAGLDCAGLVGAG